MPSKHLYHKRAKTGLCVECGNTKDTPLKCCNKCRTNNNTRAKKHYKPLIKRYTIPCLLCGASIRFTEKSIFRSSKCRVCSLKKDIMDIIEERKCHIINVNLYQGIRRILQHPDTDIALCRTIKRNVLSCRKKKMKNLHISEIALKNP